MKELIREELAMVSGGDASGKSVYEEVAYVVGYFVGMVGRMNEAVTESGNEVLGAMQYGA